MGERKLPKGVDGAKDPEHDAENPASMPESLRGHPMRNSTNDDPAGQQGGTEGGGRDAPRG